MGSRTQMGFHNYDEFVKSPTPGIDEPPKPFKMHLMNTPDNVMFKTLNDRTYNESFQNVEI